METNNMHNQERTSLSTLFAAFFRIGILTFGGGYAMLPMLERECVDKYGWTTRETLLDYFAISQCTPGVIAVNTATFVGSNERGAIGAAAATLGVITPSFLIILIIATLLNNFAHIAAVQHAFNGIRVAVAVLILNTVIKLFRTNVKSAGGLGLCIGAFFLSALFSMSPVYIVAAGALIGIFAGKAGKKI